MRLRYEYRNVELLPDGHVAGEQRPRDAQPSSYTNESGEVVVFTPGWCQFEARIDLFRIDAACEDGTAAERIWDLQDGYGEPGFTPCQGWDWSGIRDSSPAAIAQMDAVASEFVSDADIEQALGVSLAGRR